MEFSALMLIPLLVLMAPVLITALVLHYRRTRADMRYRFLLKLVESGTALPLTLPGERTTQQCDRRRAIVLMAGGIGLSATMLALPINYHVGHPVSDLWGLGVLPFVLGLGYLGNWYLSRRGSVHG